MASVSISGLRRNIKNVAHNYTDAQVQYANLERNIHPFHLRLKYVKLPLMIHGVPPALKCLRLQTLPITWFVHNFLFVSKALFVSKVLQILYQVAFSEIMQMIWKRLNDHGKNWRHVYKALVLLEYLIKTGSEKVEFEIVTSLRMTQLSLSLSYLLFCRWPSSARRIFLQSRP